MRSIIGTPAVFKELAAALSAMAGYFQIRPLRLSVASVLVLCNLLSALLQVQADPLVGPVNVFRQRARYNEEITEVPCPQPHTLPARIVNIGFYSDPPVNSKVDPVKEREFYAALAPVRNAEESLSQLLTLFVRADAAHAPPFAECILKLVLQFALDNAMVETEDLGGSGQVRLLAFPPIFSYAVLVGSYPIPAQIASLIEPWVRKLMERILFYTKALPYHNNIDYWGAATLAAGAVVLQDNKLLVEAVSLVNRALDEVTDNGLLPRELARGDLALVYNLSATKALWSVVAFSDRNGYELAKNVALTRLTSRMAKAVLDPNSFIELTRNPATVDKKNIHPSNLAWTALATSLGAGDGTSAVFCRYEKLYNFRAGGDWSVLFGNRQKCSGP